MRAAIFLFMLIACLFSCNGISSCGKKTLVVAVIDTGFGYRDVGHNVKLCRFGHKDFSKVNKFSKTYDTIDPIPIDTNGHGTNIVGIIDKYAKDNDNYCIVILKYYDESQSAKENIARIAKAVKYATNIHASVINMSGGGQTRDEYEYKQVKNFLDKGGIFVAAAGNEGQDLDKEDNDFYPAMYDKRIVVVGNMTSEGRRVASSNYGSVVNRWEIGFEVEALGIKMTGTSQATAVATGKIVANKKITCDSRL